MVQSKVDPAECLKRLSLEDSPRFVPLLLLSDPARSGLSVYLHKQNLTSTPLMS